jgi:single-strand DNA-binding protein
MSGEPVITLVGNLVADPELHFTSSGQTVAKFRIASTPRYLDRQSNEWKDGDSIFLTCSVWRQAAENVVESLRRGMRVIVVGRLKQHSYQNKMGEQGTVCEIEVDEVGPSLHFITARVTKNVRVRVSAPAGAGTEPTAPADDPFAPAVSPSDSGRAATEDQKAPF